MVTVFNDKQEKRFVAPHKKKYTLIAIKLSMIELPSLASLSLTYTRVLGKLEVVANGSHTKDFIFGFC